MGAEGRERASSSSLSHWERAGLRFPSDIAVSVIHSLCTYTRGDRDEDGDQKTELQHDP